MRCGHDPRAVANFLLDVAAEINRPVSNLAINKVAYFLHGAYLAKYSKPLIRAKIEAWEYGPVIREIYYEFQRYRDQPIRSPAMRINRETGDKEICYYEFDSDEIAFLRPIAESYLKMRAGYLVDLSHVSDGPWHEVWFHNDRVNPGMQISDDLIQRFFYENRRH